MSSNKKSKEQLLNNIIGQLEGIKNMIEQKKDCFDVIIQIKAVRSAFDNFTQVFSEENFIECSSQLNKKEKEKMAKLLKEIIKN
jgi:DNA-binding FrmR family transcriptional regulator